MTTIMEEIRSAVAQDIATLAAGLDLKNGAPVTTDQALYHGGVGHLNIGDLILSPSVTKFLRPQRCVTESGVSVPWLEQKSTYRDDYTYCTRDYDLAKNHAAGLGNWVSITGAENTTSRLGSVYRVVPYRCVLELDLSGPCCCKKPHPRIEPCQMRCKRMRIIEVVERDVRAVWDSDWRLRLKNLESAYKDWRDMRGGENWYERNSLR